MPVRAGFTLIEMVVSLSIMSIVFLAMGSVMLMATKAIPSAESPTLQSLDASDVMRQFATEIQTARTVTAATPSVIEFTVPDRDGDFNDDNIKYEWSGNAGDTLYRQYNGGTTVAVLPAVQLFTLTYTSGAGTQPGSSSTSSEQELGSHVAITPTNYQMLSGAAIGQPFMPQNLPADATSWNVTRVLVMLKSQGEAIGGVNLQLRPIGPGGLPTSTILEQQPISESDLSNTYIWQNITFNNVTGLDPAEGLCIVVEHASGDIPAAVQYDLGNGADLVNTIDGGANWTSYPNNQLSYYVYGVFESQAPPTPVGQLRTVSAVINTGQTDASLVRTTVTTLNRPEMP